MTQPISILIVDDHEVFRAEARAMLETAGYEIVGEAIDAADALAKASALNPSVVLLDVQLPDLDGFSVASEMATLPQPPRVVLCSSRTAADYGRRLTRAPAAGFIQKADLSRAELKRVLESAS
jgi:DNA-binding NarL/FixJ family response regulator